jgi:uncharacterized membrane protein YecN with MAPEG domain
MTASIPLITALVAAILGILGSVLTANVIRNRLRTGTGVDDGGIPGLARAIRAHCNFTEQTPLTLLLLGLA